MAAHDGQLLNRWYLGIYMRQNTPSAVWHDALEKHGSRSVRMNLMRKRETISSGKQCFCSCSIFRVHRGKYPLHRCT